MCGIAGIVSLDGRAPVDRERLARMRDVLRHRGPDGEGLWAEGPVGLGHRRLAVVDIEHGAQPMSNEDGRLQLVFNGEIYNHAALRPELERRGHRYRSRSDTETILHLYEEHGEGCVEMLRGMFAFALWDRDENRLLLARDRLGIKPLYYAQTDHELLFASEIKALLVAQGRRPALDVSVLPEFLATRFVSGEHTFFQGVRKLLPARTLTWDRDRGPHVRRYWSLPPDGAHRTRAGAGAGATVPKLLRDELRQVVGAHLMSDVPLGLFLSGGLDSSLLASLMADLSAEPIRTYAVGTGEPEADELGYARQVAAAVGARHREVTVSPAEFFETLPSLVWHEDEPIAFPSSVLLYFVSMLARDEVKVVLSGEGADELFLGYNWYRVTAWNERLGRSYWRHVPPGVQRAVRRSISGSPRRLHRYLSRSFLALENDPRSLFCENFAVFDDTRRERLLRSGPSAGDADPYAAWLQAYGRADGSLLGRMSRSDLQTFVVELLMKQDQMSMAASLESRVPYLDHELVEHVARMPSAVKLRGWRTKAILRDAARGAVPEAILSRRKMGFPAPMDRWLRGPFSHLLEELVLGRRALDRGLFEPAELRTLVAEHRGGVRHGERLWLLMNLELWHRIFIDGEQPGAAMRSGS